MTLTSTASRIEYTTTGGLLTYAYPFRILADADLVVYLDGTLKALTTHYTVTGADSVTGGNVVLTADPGGGKTLIIYRDVVASQGTDFVENTKSSAETDEKALDRLTMLVQQLEDFDRRALAFKPTSLLKDPILPDGVVAKLLRWKTNTELENVDKNDLNLSLSEQNILAGYTLAGLPPAGTAGRLARVTDDVRGVWIDIGTAWRKLIPKVLASDFGFSPTATAAANNTAIQAALDAADASTQYKEVLLDVAGTSDVTGLLAMGSNTAIDGGHWGLVRLRKTTTGASLSGIITNKDQVNGNTNLAVRNITFERTVEISTSFDEYIYFKNSNRILVENNRFLYSGTIGAGGRAQKGVHLQGCQYGTVRKNHFEDIPDNPVAVNWLGTTLAGHHDISGNTFRRSSGLTLTNSQVIVTQHYVKVNENLFSGPATRTGNWVETGLADTVNSSFIEIENNIVVGFGMLVHESSFVDIIGNTLDNSLIHIDQTTGANDNIKIDNNIIKTGRIIVKFADHFSVTNNKISDSDDSGIAISNSTSHMEIAHNVVRRSQKNGILVDSGATGKIVVKDNIAYDNGLAASVDAWFGIFLGVAFTDAQLTGNTTYDTQGTPTQRHGIAVNGGTRLTFVGNVSRDNLTGAYREVTAPTYAFRSGNIFDGVLQRQETHVIATASLPGASADNDGRIIVEDAGAGDRNLIIYGGGQRFRIDGGAAF